MIEEGLVQLITSDPRFQQIAADRLYPLLLPDETNDPSATYQVISTVALYTNDGSTGFITSRIQFDAWSQVYAECKTIAAAIRAALEDFTGMLSEGTRVLNIMLDNSTDLYEGNARLYRVTADFKVQYLE